MNGRWLPLEPFSLACAVGLLALLSAVSGSQSQDERAVRAAYVFNLSRYVEWPSEKKELVIGFIGPRDTGEFLLKMLDGKMSESRPIRVMLFPSDAELPRCSMLYIADSQTKKIRAALEKVEGKSIVTVGEADSFAQDGGMVGLVKVGEVIHMQVNLEVTQRAGIKISSRLLNLALIVRPGISNPSQQEERKIVQSEDPEYPEMAAKMSLHGTVKFKIRIAPDGTVRRIEYIGGHPLLAQSAEKAVKNWKYEPTARESTQIVDVKF